MFDAFLMLAVALFFMMALVAFIWACYDSFNKE